MLPFVRHEHFNRANNAASNLEWCSDRTNPRKAQNAGRFTAPVSPTRAKTLHAETASVAYTLRVAGMTFREIATILRHRHRGCHEGVPRQSMAAQFETYAGARQHAEAQVALALL